MLAVRITPENAEGDAENRFQTCAENAEGESENQFGG
jgi:hypothetical protein